MVASTLDRDKPHEVLDQAVIAIDESDLERSRRDPRVRDLHASADQSGRAEARAVAASG